MVLKISTTDTLIYDLHKTTTNIVGAKFTQLRFFTRMFTYQKNI